MKTSARGFTFLLAVTAVSVILLYGSAVAYNINDMVLRDSNGAPIVPGSNTPYSPKQTCGTVGCHIDMVRSFGMTSGNIYESGPAPQPRTTARVAFVLCTPYPEHGVSAGYHFQSGNNMPWGELQRNFYQDLAFTSSPGLYGRYCPAPGRQLAGLSETTVSQFDMSSYDFSARRCALVPFRRRSPRVRPGRIPLQRHPGSISRPAQIRRRSGVTIIAWMRRPRASWIRPPKRGRGGQAEIDCLICHLSSNGHPVWFCRAQLCADRVRFSGPGCIIGACRGVRQHRVPCDRTKGGQRGESGDQHRNLVMDHRGARSRRHNLAAERELRALPFCGQGLRDAGTCRVASDSPRSRKSCLPVLFPMPT